jgi:hypothetical protein
VRFGRLTYSLAGALLALLLQGCRTTETDIAGTWELRYPFALETLVLLDDGSYTQVIVYDTGETVSSTGVWTMRKDDIVPRLSFDDMLIPYGQFGVREFPPRKTNVSLPFEFGRIGKYGDLGWSYSRAKETPSRPSP